MEFGFKPIKDYVIAIEISEFNFKLGPNLKAYAYTIITAYACTLLVQLSLLFLGVVHPIKLCHHFQTLIGSQGMVSK